MPEHEENGDTRPLSTWEEWLATSRKGFELRREEFMIARKQAEEARAKLRRMIESARG